MQILKIQVTLLYYTILGRKKQCVLVKIYKEIASFTFTDREKFTSKWTWIQFDKTFEGLLIAITDPEYRIFSSTEHLNSPQKNVDEYIAKISFNQKNNDN